MRNAGAKTVSAMLAMGFISGAALADDYVDEIVVEGRTLSLDKLNAVKTPTPIIDIPQSLSIISNEQIADQAFTSIGDILRYTPGLSVSQGEGNRDAIVIRGNSSTADFFIDGLRDDVQYFRPLYNIEQIEILRGSNALLFGRGGGGVINRVTKRPVIGEQFAGFTTGADTFGAYNFNGDVNYTLGENGAFRLNGFYEKLKNHRDFYKGRRYAINPTLEFKLGSNTMLDLSYEYVNDDRTVDRGIPSVPVAGGPGAPLSGVQKTFFGSPDQNLTTLVANIARAKIDHIFSDHLRGNLTVQYADYDKLYQNIFPVGFDVAANMVTLDGYQDTTTRENLIVQWNMVGEFATGPFKHTLLFGAEYGDQDSNNARNDNLFASTMDDQATIPFTDPLSLPAFGFTVPARDRSSEVKFTSVYVQDQIDVTDWLKIVAGGRYDRFDIDVVDQFEVANGAADGNDGFLGRVDEEISPRFGVILKPAENFSLYGSYSESFLPRSGDQFLSLTLTSEALDPQTFKNEEVGAKWDVTKGLSVTAALFRLKRASVTTADPLNPGNTIILDGTTTKGFELQIVGDVTDYWHLSGGFSYLDSEIKGGSFNGNRTKQTPEAMFSLWNHFKMTEKLGLGAGVTHQSSMFASADNAVLLPGYTRIDAAVYYDLTDTLRIQANIENLTDEEYFPDAHNNNNISTGEPLNARFTVSGRF